MSVVLHFHSSKVNDIEYNIRLYVTDEDSDAEITEEIFENFDQMNEFLEKTEYDAKYINAKAEYTFVEVVDGIPDEAASYFFELTPYMPLMPEEIEDVIYEMEVIIPEEKAELDKIFKKNQTFHPEIEALAPDDASKNIPLNEYVYLCPGCLHEVQQCTCSFYPMYLIQIDCKIAPVIRELNMKGYKTASCCAGHPSFTGKKSSQLIYISFEKRFDFPIPLPEGSKYRKEGDSLCFDIIGNPSVEELKLYQEECINKLLKWAQELPRR